MTIFMIIISVILFVIEVTQIMLRSHKEILRLSKELEAVKTRDMVLTKCIKDLKYNIRDTRFAINATIAECLDENHQFKPTSKVTKQDLLNALQTISVLINE